LRKVVIITGISGFVGRKLGSKLLNLGYEVIGIDVTDPCIDGLKFFQANIAEEIKLPILNDSNYSTVVHLAAMSTDSQCRNNPTGAMASNLIGTTRVIELANQIGAAQLVFASSEWVYPELNYEKLQKECDSLKLEDLTSLYAMTKLMGENLVRTICLIPYVILRFGIVYGPRQSPGSAPESIVHKISKGETTSLGSGSTARRFIFIDDLVEGICLAVDNRNKLNAKVFNLSGEKLISLMAIADISKAICQASTEVIDLRSTPSIRNPDPTRFQLEVGFSPKVSIRDGLKACLELMS